MRLAFLLAFLLPGAAHADLYRWVDPETGSVKFSNLPPSSAVGSVERVPYVPFGAPRPEAAKPAPALPAVAGLEARRRLMRQAIDAMPVDANTLRSGQGLAQQLQAYHALRVEMDRVDPAGAARRRAEDEPLMQRIAQGLGVPIETQGAQR